MKKKVFVIVIALSLIFGVIYLAVGIGRSLIIGVILILLVALVGITVQMKGGVDSQPETETDKLGVKHDSETRSTALGCYGPEAEEEKMVYYEEPPPKKTRQK